MFVSTSAAQAAALGPLTLSSDFGRPLRATVEILDTVPGQAPLVDASIASPDTYRELGLPYPRSLDGARVTIRPTTTGRWVVGIQGRSPVDETEFNMVLSLLTAEGRQVRNYRLTGGPELPVVAGAEPSTTPTSVAPSPAQEPAPPLRDFAPAPMRSSPGGPVAEDSGRPAVASVAAQPATLTVMAGDTASAIARRVLPADVRLEQAVMALYRANVDRFGGSVHRLPAGAVLRLPEPDRVRGLPLAQALAEWQAQTPAAGGTAADQAGRDRLSLAGGAGAAGSRAAKMAHSVAVDNALAEAQSRVRELESIVAGLRTLVETRDRQLQALKAQSVGAPATGADLASAGARRPAAPVGAAPATAVSNPIQVSAATGTQAPDAGTPVSLFQALAAGLATMLVAGAIGWWARSRTDRGTLRRRGRGGLSQMPVPGPGADPFADSETSRAASRPARA